MSNRNRVYIAVAGIVAAVALGAVSLFMLMGGVQCEDVRSQGQRLKVEADAAGPDRLGEQISKTREMLALVDDNRQCFTDSELAEVEVGRKILNDMS